MIKAVENVGLLVVVVLLSVSPSFGQTPTPLPPVKYVEAFSASVGSTSEIPASIPDAVPTGAVSDLHEMEPAIDVPGRRLISPFSLIARYTSGLWRTDPDRGVDFANVGSWMHGATFASVGNMLSGIGVTRPSDEEGLGHTLLFNGVLGQAIIREGADGPGTDLRAIGMLLIGASERRFFTTEPRRWCV